MFEFLFIFVTLVAPLAAVGFLIVAVLATVAHRRLWPRQPAQRWLYFAGLLLACASVIYEFALLDSGVLASPKSCRAPLSDAGVDHGNVVAVESAMFPLRFVCGFADGTNVEMAPDWINPTVMSVLVAAFVCLATALSVAWRTATSTKQS